MKNHLEQLKTNGIKKLKYGDGRCRKRCYSSLLKQERIIFRITQNHLHGDTKEKNVNYYCQHLEIIIHPQEKQLINY